MHESAPIKPAARQQACYAPIANHRLLLLMGGLLLLLQGCATTPPPPSLSEEAFTQAKVAYLDNDYPRAFTIAGPRAAAGDPWAQYTLGYLYYYGRGVALDRKLAKEWIQRAAEQGYAPAQEALQHISAAAPKMEQDVNTSAKPTRPAAENNAVPMVPIPPPAEEVKEQTQPSPQAATPPPAAMPPPTAPSPGPAAADQASEPSAPIPAPQTPETAPAAPEPAVAPPAADSTTPPQENSTNRPPQ